MAYTESTSRSQPLVLETFILMMSATYICPLRRVLAPSNNNNNSTIARDSCFQHFPCCHSRRQRHACICSIRPATSFLPCPSSHDLPCTVFLLLDAECCNRDPDSSTGFWLYHSSRISADSTIGYRLPIRSCNLPKAVPPERSSRLAEEVPSKSTSAATALAAVWIGRGPVTRFHTALRGRIGLG